MSFLSSSGRVWFPYCTFVYKTIQLSDITVVCKILIQQQKQQTLKFLCSFFTHSCAIMLFVFLFPFFLSVLLLILSVSLPITFSNVKNTVWWSLWATAGEIGRWRSERQRKRESVLHQRRSWSASAAKPSKHCVGIAQSSRCSSPSKPQTCSKLCFSGWSKSDALSSQIKSFC